MASPTFLAEIFDICQKRKIPVLENKLPASRSLIVLYTQKEAAFGAASTKWAAAFGRRPPWWIPLSMGVVRLVRHKESFMGSTS